MKSRIVMKSYEKDRKKAEKKAQCDKIEGLRAAIS